MKNLYVKDLVQGSTISIQLLVSKKEIKKKKNGEPYIHFRLSDATGVVDANLWDSVDAVRTLISENDIAFFDADVGEYRGNTQLTIRNIRQCAMEEIDMGDYIKSIDNIEMLCSKLTEHISNVQNIFLKRLADMFLSDQDFMKQFKMCPGGMGWHHAYRGGLMKHTCEVMEIGLLMSHMHPEVNKDLVVVGTFLHDIGKVLELEYELRFDYTDRGKMIGHICMGLELVTEKIKVIDGFPNDLAQEIRHIVLSHQGEYEQRSPVLPQTIEACIVYHADNLSSQVNAFKSVVFGPRQDGDVWSKWYPIINRQLLLRDEKENIF